MAAVSDKTDLSTRYLSNLGMLLFPILSGIAEALGNYTAATRNENLANVRLQSSSILPQ
ncbi:hypothetical protein [Paraburkholderia sp. 40]|uniref:hypothetical protein n=1 Tax=Paraburkholderia sp. 40 TaxID=2991059 RepID=UPI003D195AC6